MSSATATQKPLKAASGRISDPPEAESIFLALMFFIFEWIFIYHPLKRDL
jgi:hypothetical protein